MSPVIAEMAGAEQKSFIMVREPTMDAAGHPKNVPGANLHL